MQADIHGPLIVYGVQKSVLRVLTLVNVLPSPSMILRRNGVIVSVY